MSKSKLSVNSTVEESKFDWEYYNYLVGDAGLTSAEAAIIANGLSEFKEEVSKGNIFRDRKEGQEKWSEEQILQFYLGRALNYGKLDIIKYLISEMNVSLPQEQLFHFLFLQNPYEGKKNPQKMMEIYNYLIHEKIIIDINPVLESIFLREAKSNNYAAVTALLELGCIPNINITDSEGHTVLYYCILESRKNRFSLNPEKLIELGASLSNKDKEVLELGDLVDAVILSMETPNQERLEELRKVLATKMREIPGEQIDKCLLKAIEFNDIKTLQLLLPVCNPDLLKVMFGKVNSVESASLLIDYFVKNGFALYERASLAAFAHRLGLNEYSAGFMQSNEFLLHVLRGLTSQFDVSEDFKAIEQSLQKTVLLNLISNPAVVRKYLYQAYAKGEPVLLTVGWSQHGVGLAVVWDEKSNKTYVLFSNRGEGGLKSCLTDKSLIEDNQRLYGSVIYELDGKLDEEFFSHFEIGENKQGFFRYRKEKFEEDVEICLKDAKILLPFILASTQKYGTCGYVNTKQLIRGLSGIFSLIKGESLSENLIEEIGRNYKSFSAYDKNSACEELIKVYQSESMMFSKYILEQYQDFIVKLILSHCTSDKPDNIERMRLLFAVLPEDVKEKLAYIIPSHIATKLLEDKSSTLVSLSIFKTHDESTPQNKYVSDNPIKVGTVSVDNLLNQYKEMSTILNFLQSRGYTGDDILEVVLENNMVHIHTKPDRNFKYEVRDLFAKDLQVQVTNVEGRFEFILKDLGEVAFVLNKLNKQGPEDTNKVDFSK